MRLLENTVLRKRDEATGDWRRLHSGERHDLFSPANIIRGGQIEKEMVGACSTYMERGEVHVLFWCRNLRESDHFVYIGIDERIILK